MSLYGFLWTCKLVAQMACFWSPHTWPLLLILFLCFSASYKLVESIRTYPYTPFPTYCTVDPITGVCRYPEPVPNCPFIDRIRGRCSPLAPVAPPVSIALPPLVSPAPAPAHKISDVFDPPPLAFPLGPQAFILIPPEAPAPQTPPVYGLPVDQPMPPQLPLPYPFGEPQPPSGAVAAPTPEFVGLPVDLPLPNQPPFPMPSEPGPSIPPPLEAPGLSSTPLLPAQPPALSELPINIPSPPLPASIWKAVVPQLQRS